jgi:poly(A) polymerase
MTADVSMSPSDDTDNHWEDCPSIVGKLSWAAEKVIEKLQKAGFKAYLVGGGVRDLLLRRQPKDFDIVSDARPEEIRRLFRNSRLIGRRFPIIHVFYDKEVIEVSTFRALGGGRRSESGLLLQDRDYGNIEEDVLRRDFTVNALYFDPQTNCILDYVNGIEDLRAKRLVMIGNPEERYREDPVRMLRAVRFAAKLGLTFDSAVVTPIAGLAQHLRFISQGRLFDEVGKLCNSQCFSKISPLLQEHGLWEALFPAEDYPELSTYLRNERWLQSLTIACDRLSDNQGQLLFLAAALWPNAEVNPFSPLDIFQASGRLGTIPMPFVQSTLKIHRLYKSLLKGELPPEQLKEQTYFSVAYQLFCWHGHDPSSLSLWETVTGIESVEDKNAKVPTKNSNKKKAHRNKKKKKIAQKIKGLTIESDNDKENTSANQGDKSC